jgi:DNA-binding transcriptional LysR family regulator
MSINISFKLLKAFLMLSEHKNFTRAAEHCHVSQSTFSGMIKRLEDELGARLFDRNTRNVVLTPEGDLFAEAARHLVNDIQWTFSDLSDYVAKKKGRVGIATLPSIAGEWLPSIIAKYRCLYPGIAIEIHDVLSDSCLDLLQQGQVDIALAAPNASLGEYSSEHFYTDNFFLVCRRDHPIAANPTVSMSDLHGLDFIRLARTTSVHQHIVNAVGATGVTSSSFEVKYLSTVAGLILHGLGVSLLPELTLSQFRHPELIAIPLEPPGISRPIHIIWLKDKPLSIAAQALLEMLRQEQGRVIVPTPVVTA